MIQWFDNAFNALKHIACLMRALANAFRVLSNVFCASRAQLRKIISLNQAVESHHSFNAYDVDGLQSSILPAGKT